MNDLTPLPTLLSLSPLRFAPDWRMPRHVHREHHELIFLRGGRITVATQGQQVLAGVGDALVYAQGTEHEEWAQGSVPLHMSCLVWHGPLSESWPLVHSDRHGRMAMLLDWMQELSPAHQAEDRQTQDFLLGALLAEYGSGGVAQDDARLTQARAFVMEHLSEPLCLDDLAAAACLSRFHFATVFRAQMGIAPMEWVRRMRVEAARTLLLTSTLPLSAIAFRVGLRDEFHLSRVFRRVTGQSPSAVRRPF